MSAPAPSRSLTGDLSVAFVGHFLAKGLGIATFILTTRGGLDPAQYGLFALASSVAEIALYLSELGLETGITRFVARGLRQKDEERTERLLKIVFIARYLSAAAVYAVGYLLAPYIADHLLYKPDLVPHLRIAFVGVFGVHLTSFYGAYFSARLAFGTRAVFSLMAPVFIFLGIAWMRWRGSLTVLNCLQIYYLVPVVVCAVVMAVMPHDFLRRSARGAGVELLEVWRFSRWIWVTNVLSTLRFRLNSILLARLATEEAVGLYNYGDKLAATLTLFTDTILTVLLPRASHLVTRDEARGLLGRSYRWMLLLLPALLVVPLGSRPLIGLLAPEYTAAAPIFAVLFISILFSLAALPSRTVLYSINEPQFETGIEVLALFITLTASYALTSSIGVLGAAVAMLIQRFVSSALTIGFVFHRVYRGGGAQAAES